MRIKRCVGAIVYNDDSEIFLMTSPKWRGFVVPGGEVLPGESEDSALHREIMEELGIRISALVKVGEKVKPPSHDFKDQDIEFHFIDYFAKAESTEITPNHELEEYGWFALDEALALPLLDTTRQLVLKFAQTLK